MNTEIQWHKDSYIRQDFRPVILQSMSGVTEFSASNISGCVDPRLVVYNGHDLILEGGVVEAHLVGHQNLHIGPASGYQILRRENAKVRRSLVNPPHAV